MALAGDDLLQQTRFMRLPLVEFSFLFFEQKSTCLIVAKEYKR